MRIIIDLDESGGVVVERQEDADARNRVSAAPAISVIDAGPPPAWLLRALGVTPVAPRAAAETWEGVDAGPART